MNKLIESIQNSPLVQAAITEAVHRFYMDNVMLEREGRNSVITDTDCANVLSTLWNLQPNWRYIIQKAGKRYTPDAPNTDSVSIYGKPKQPTTLTLNIEIK